MSAASTSLTVIEAGLQTTVQAGPRLGLRHLGVPSAGAADPLSLALANRLVGNDLAAPGLEVTLSGMKLRTESACSVAVTGAACAVSVDGQPAAMHERLFLEAGAEFRIGAAETGVRSYLAVVGGVLVDEMLGSRSTYLPASLGGYRGRALEAGDGLVMGEAQIAGGRLSSGRLSSGRLSSDTLQTPERYRPDFRGAWSLRVCPGAEFASLTADSRERLADGRYAVGRRSDRMGVALDGVVLKTGSTGVLDSRPVFPGTLQCPEGGQPLLLGVDAQTTGGYPRVAEVIRADRQWIGQLRSGDRLRFLVRDTRTAQREYAETLDFWREWLPGIETLI